MLDPSVLPRNYKQVFLVALKIALSDNVHAYCWLEIFTKYLTSSLFDWGNLLIKILPFLNVFITVHFPSYSVFLFRLPFRLLIIYRVANKIHSKLHSCLVPC